MSKCKTRSAIVLLAGVGPSQAALRRTGSSCRSPGGAPVRVCCRLRCFPLFPRQTLEACTSPAAAAAGSRETNSTRCLKGAAAGGAISLPSLSRCCRLTGRTRKDRSAGGRSGGSAPSRRLASRACARVWYEICETTFGNRGQSFVEAHVATKHSE